MDLRLTLLNLWLRLAVKAQLRRVQDPLKMRAQLARSAARHFSPPDGANFHRETIRRDEDRAAATMDALWASCGRPDRRKVLLYLHGGAYIAGSPDTHRHLGAALAGAAGVRALLPAYRLAPEHPFPAALEDAVTTYRHLLDAGYEAPSIALAGDSAGGGLAFSLQLRLAELDLPKPGCVVGFSPWTDMTGTLPSLAQNARRDAMLPARRFQVAAGFYLGEADPMNPLISPLRGAWSDPPPTLLMASRHEILLDDTRHLAEALRRAGGDVQIQLWRRLPHAWPFFTGRLAQADQAVAIAGAFIARHLGAEPEG
ncbi:MAG: alpha/beta hydrolase [Pseudomonadota bacterium]